MMKKVYGRPKSLKKAPYHYCPGCGHSIAHRLICEVIDEMNLQDKAIGIPPPGCSVFAYHYFDVDMAESAHGRGAAVATGVKRAFPEAIVFTYQGDGDLAAIGTAETIHAANRGENITAIFINNAVYGMTGGQMAPTTMLTQKTTTTPFGRDAMYEGYPIQMSEIIALVKGTAYVERVAVNSPANIRKAKKAISKAFQVQIDHLGFSLVEILSPCPTNWKMSPLDAWQWIDKEMTKVFPLGVIKEVAGRKDAD
jgi:2-oxoglutarate ferredoxin oxidoreductase subunit beta